MSIISETEEPKRPGDHEQISRMLEAFRLITAALEPLAHDEQLRLVRAIWILIDKREP
jgi:hypothetical protein